MDNKLVTTIRAGIEDCGALIRGPLLLLVIPDFLRAALLASVADRSFCLHRILVDGLYL